jgi:nucleotide-binding universal stress UspA family protein
MLLAETMSATITLLHVMEPPHERWRSHHAFDPVGWEIARREASAYLKRCEEQAAEASRGPVETRLEEGHAADRILAVAHELRADLTVLAPNGEDADRSAALGSTAQQVLARPRGSVLVAHSAADAGAFRPRRILVPLDGSPRTESTLPTAVQIAKRCEADLFLAHVVPELVPSSILRSAEDVEMAGELTRRLETRAKAYLGERRESLIREVSSVTAIVARHADQAQSLLEIVQRERIDFVVLSAHGATCNLERSFGGVTTHLLSHSKVPVLALQDLTESDAASTADWGPLLRTRPPNGGP